MPHELLQTSHESVINEATAFVDKIAYGPAVQDLAKSFGYMRPESDNPTDELEALKTFTNKYWNFRNGGERWNAVAPDFKEESDAIFAAADEWNMVKSTEPTKDHYDFVTVPGGGKVSPFYRVKYAKEQMEKHGLEIPYMILLGSARPLDKKNGEPEAAAFYAPNAKDEFDLMNASVETHYDIKHDDERIINLYNTNPNAADRDMWRVRLYETDDGMKIFSVSAPQIEGTSRVNTGDTYLFMEEVVGKEMLSGKDVLNVTGAQFTAFQHADALRLLGLKADAHIETIGYEAAYAGTERMPHELLQEMNSAINQAYMLDEALGMAA